MKFLVRNKKLTEEIERLKNENESLQTRLNNSIKTNDSMRIRLKNQRKEIKNLTIRLKKGILADNKTLFKVGDEVYFIKELDENYIPYDYRMFKPSKLSIISDICIGDDGGIYYKIDNNLIPERLVFISKEQIDKRVLDLNTACLKLLNK